MRRKQDFLLISVMSLQHVLLICRSFILTSLVHTSARIDHCCKTPSCGQEKSLSHTHSLISNASCSNLPFHWVWVFFVCIIVFVLLWLLADHKPLVGASDLWGGRHCFDRFSYRSTKINYSAEPCMVAGLMVRVAYKSSSSLEPLQERGNRNDACGKGISVHIHSLSEHS